MSPRSLEVVNRVIIPGTSETPPFATGNTNKQNEIANLLGKPLDAIDFVSLTLHEIQSDNPEEVAITKAIQAYEQNGFQPVVIEDTSLEIPAIRHLFPPTFVKYWAGDRRSREQVAMALEEDDPTAYAQVVLAVYDGEQVHMRVGVTEGKIVSPAGRDIFGWDDIFVPVEGDGRRYSEMNLEEKNQTSPRARAFAELRENPFEIGYYIFKTPDPYPFQSRAIDVERLSQDPTALTYAFDLGALRPGITNTDLVVRPEDFRPFYMIPLNTNGDAYTFVNDPDSPSLGLVYTGMDIKVGEDGEPKRLEVRQDGQTPQLRQIGPESVRKALASRALEFQLFHNPEMYAQLREMLQLRQQDGRYVPARQNRRSEIIEKIIGLKVDGKRVLMPEFGTQEYEDSLEMINERGVPTKAATVESVGYAREYSSDEMSRTSAANTGLFTDASGIPTALFGLGGMPGISGSVDTLVSAALSYMDAYIPHNSVFTDNFERRLELFCQARDRVIKLGLPDDITDLCIQHIGMAFGTGDIKKIEREVREFMAAGGRLVRMYTTNPDSRKIKAVQTMRQVGGDDLRICVGPIVDTNEAKALIHPDIAVNIMLAGHGGGENCTSIDGGNGAYTGLELLYLMSINPRFNNVAIGLEGGTGNAFGGVLGMLDVISLNRRGIAGGVESTGGLYFVHRNKRYVTHYPGTASPVNQWVEVFVSEEARAKRIDAAGRIRNDEGKPNYMTVPHHIVSVVDAWFESRMVGGRVLADQRSLSLRDLRHKINTEGYNLRQVPDAARATAKAHTSN